MIRTRNFKQSHNHKTLLAFMGVALFSLVGGSSQSAYAQCLRGLPCETVPTAAQLTDPTTGPNASKSTTAACDANFMNQIYAKAFLEAEREVVINNSLMLKPDSVLEYSCFDQQAAAVANDAGPIFSESTRWSPANVSIQTGSVSINVNMGPTRLDNSINRLVLESLETYVDTNFAHDFLGGAASGDNNTISSSVAGISGTPCDFMYLVHDVSKCDAFALNTQFMTFESYFSTPSLLSTDPRTLPRTCPAGHQITSARLDVSKNATWNFVSFDRVNTLLPIQRPESSGTCENSTPIPTGVVVIINENDQDLAGNPIAVNSYQYDDKVCSNPACTFDHRGDANGANDRCVP